MNKEKGFFSKLIEHFATKRKLNKMTIKYNVKCEEYEEARRRNDSEKKVREHMKEAYEQSIKELTKEKIDLQIRLDKSEENIKTLRRKIRETNKKNKLKKEKENEK